MAVTTPPNITPAPSPPPQRNDRATFSDRVDAFVTWIITAVTEFNALSSNVYLNATEAESSGISALAAASSAEANRILAGNSAASATASEITANTYATNAYESALFASEAITSINNSIDSITTLQYLQDFGLITDAAGTTSDYGVLS